MLFCKVSGSSCCPFITSFCWLFVLHQLPYSFCIFMHICFRSWLLNQIFIIPVQIISCISILLRNTYCCVTVLSFTAKQTSVLPIFVAFNDSSVRFSIFLVSFASTRITTSECSAPISGLFFFYSSWSSSFAFTSTSVSLSVSKVSLCALSP